MAVCSKTYIIRKGKSNMRKRICKKAASLALALAMAVSVCTTALAEGDTEQTTTETTSISEQTKDNGGEDGPSTETVENGATLTLDEFNALTEIPADVKELTVNLDGVDLRNGSFVVGNETIADTYRYVNTLDEMRKDETKFEPHGQGFVVGTHKQGIKLNIVGNIQFSDDAASVNSPANSLTFKIPDASDIVFSNATLNGFIRIYSSWTQSFASMVKGHKMNSLTLKDCIVNGLWVQNSGAPANDIIIDGCTFNEHKNTVSPNDSSPIWIQNIETCSVTIQNSNFTMSRPIKVIENNVLGVSFKAINNTFTLLDNNKDGSKVKEIAIYITDTKNGDTRGIANPTREQQIGTASLGNVEISGNTVIGGAALLAFTQEEPLIKMADGATFIVKDNKLGENVKTSVIWKKGVEYVPDFVTVIKPATVAISTAAPSVRADGVTDTNLIDAAKTVDISGESVDAVENSDAVVAVKADAEKTYKNEDNTWNETKLKAALANSALANTDVNKITLVVVPYLAITPKQTDAKGQLTFAIELLCDLRATTDPDNMTPDNTYTISTTNISANAPTVTIQLSVGSAFTADQLTGLYVKHDSTKSVRYYDTTVVNVDNKTIAFENPDGYSDFTVMYSADEAVVDFEGTSKTLNLTSLNDKTLPAPAKTENFLGWQFAGVDGTYTELDEALLAKLAAAYKAAHGSLELPAQYRTEEGIWLGSWLSRQKLMLREGKKLSTERCAALRELFQGENTRRLTATVPPACSVREQNWLDNYQSARLYAEKKGSLLVPAGYVDENGFRLGVWISNLRAARKARPGSFQVTPEHIALLDAIGMQWDAREAKWAGAFRRAEEYCAAHGNLLVPVNYKTEDGFCLGDWVRRMRENYACAEKKLTSERIAKLEALGMVWTVPQEG